MMVEAVVSTSPRWRGVVTQLKQTRREQSALPTYVGLGQIRNIYYGRDHVLC